ncbi:MAG: MATE family efflux transporter [Clostridia bacterium]|nr:MATE family efflux transporter [Clostridia bacterium]
MESAERLSPKQGYRDILRLMLPCLVELFLGQLVSMVDMIMVGGLGTQAINAVGICSNPTMLLMMIFTALNVGTTALISRAKGEGNIYKANQVARLALIINILAGLLMLGLGLIFNKALIAMMGSPDAQTATLSAQYLRMRIYGMPFIAIGTANNAILRGMGNARTPMIYNLAANGINVLFNWLLINGVWFFPEMGVVGAALATTISNVAAAVISCALLLHGHSDIQIKLKERFGLDTAMLSNLFRIGAPSMAEQIIFRIGLIICGRLTISLGAVDYAAHQLCWNILNIVLLCGSAMQMAISPLTGQCLGRQSSKTAEDYAKYGVHLLLLGMTLCGLLCIFLARPLLMLYSPEADVLSAALPIMRLFGIYLPTMAFQYVHGGVLSGAGDTKYHAVFFFFSSIVVRIPLTLLFKDVWHWGLLGVNLAVMLDTLLRWVLFSGRYRMGKWKTVKLK